MGSASPWDAARVVAGSPRTSQYVDTTNLDI
jgi:hypothetical protein